MYQFCKGNLNRFIMLLEGKSVYPGEYMDNWKKFNETKLPLKNAFYSELNLENITDKDYPHAKNIWDVFEIKNLGKYHDLYVQSDTLYLQIYLKVLEICVLKYMNLILYILHLHLD